MKKNLKIKISSYYSVSEFRKPGKVSIFLQGQTGVFEETV